MHDEGGQVGRRTGDQRERTEAFLVGLSAQAASLSALEDAAEAEELALAEIARIPWADRARALAGTGVRVEFELPDRSRLEGAVEAVLADGIVLEESSGGWAVWADAVRSITGLGPRTRSAGAVAARLSLATVLREWARDGSAVRCLGELGIHEGTLTRIGADHLDLAEHDRDDPRGVRAERTLPMSAVWAIRRW
jgi:hypothetical protein